METGQDSTVAAKYKLKYAKKWYEHTPAAVVENAKVVVLWNMKI